MIQDKSTEGKHDGKLLGRAVCEAELCQMRTVNDFACWGGGSSWGFGCRV